MRKRDLAIINSIEKFRVLSRDQISKLFFSDTKNPITNTNYILKRLVDRGYIIAYKNQKIMNQNLYFPHGTKIKKDGQKVSQYLDITNVYIDLLEHGEVKQIDIEPRYNGVEIRPDIYCIFRGTMFFIEAMNTKFSDKQMNEKIERYEQLYLSEKYKELPFQKYDKKYMPIILIVGESTPYNVQSSHLKIYQAKSISAFMNQFKQTNKVQEQQQKQLQKKLQQDNKNSNIINNNAKKQSNNTNSNAKYKSSNGEIKINFN